MTASADLLAFSGVAMNTVASNMTLKSDADIDQTG